MGALYTTMILLPTDLVSSFPHGHPMTGLSSSEFDIDDDSWVEVTGIRPSYEALSYTWGTTKSKEPAYVLTSESSSHSSILPMTLEIGENLAIALKHLRSESPRLLWIDAICINQMDPSERGTQISRMGEIYKAADRVVVWLGPESKKSSLAISTLDYLGRQIVLFRSFRFARAPDTTETEIWSRPTFQLPYSDVTWQAIRDFFKRPWFERVWIVQEIQLASSKSILMCGPDILSWQTLRASIYCLFAKVQFQSSSILREVPECIKTLSTNRLNETFPDLLSLLQRRKCT